MKFLLKGILILSMVSFGSANAITIHKQEFPDIHEATLLSPKLHLRGGSVRKVYGFVNTYVGLLYVEDETLAPEEILSANVARRMEFHLLSNRVTSRRFMKVIDEGLSINTTPEQMAVMEPRVKELFDLFDYRFVKGTVGFIEWVPAEQVSRVVINGEVRGTVAGKDLSDALLSIWIGEHPVSVRFKEEVLGLEASED